VAGPVRRRWDTDARGRGEADATAFAPAIEELAQLARRPEWVAEEPRVHLLPHLQAAAAAEGCRLADVREDGGVLHVQVATTAAGAGDVRRVSVRLIASIAETSTFVHERREGDTAVFDVVTGLPPESTGFETHGHAVRLHVRPVSSRDGVAGAERDPEQG
jgi:hypothetical protein